MKYSAFVPSNNPALAQQAVNSFSGCNVKIFDGTIDGENYPSFSKLINDCILAAEEEVVIIINHKIRGNFLHIDKIRYLLKQGYGLVSLQNFHMFGFKKDLIRRIGWFDERFLGGNYEDSDFVRRVIEAKIAWYDATEVPVIPGKTSWDSRESEKHFLNKWKDGQMERLMPDEEYDYDIGEDQGSVFLPLSKTKLSKTNEDYYRSIGFEFKD